MRARFMVATSTLCAILLFSMDRSMWQTWCSIFTIGTMFTHSVASMLRSKRSSVLKGHIHDWSRSDHADSVFFCVDVDSLPTLRGMQTPVSNWVSADGSCYIAPVPETCSVSYLDSRMAYMRAIGVYKRLLSSDAFVGPHRNGRRWVSYTWLSNVKGFIVAKGNLATPRS